MISWILGILIVAWLIYKRTRPDGKVEEYPLGLPRGSIRALITILIVAFPFNYLIRENPVPIPGLIVNTIFIVTAFYFEARKPSEEKLKRIIKEITKPEKFKEEEKKLKKPLYLPKYSVRISLLILLISFILIDTYSVQFPFVATNTFVDLILIIGLYIIGSLIRGISVRRSKVKIKEEVESMKDYQTLSKYEIIEKIMDEKPSWWMQKGKSFASLTVLVAVIVALMSYTIAWDMNLLILGFYTFTLRQTLLLLVSVYYGFRD